MKIDSGAAYGLSAVSLLESFADHIWRCVNALSIRCIYLCVVVNQLLTETEEVQFSLAAANCEVDTQRYVLNNPVTRIDECIANERQALYPRPDC